MLRKIYFGCSMRGGHAYATREELERVGWIIETLGATLVTRHQTEPDIFSKEALLSAKQIHDRDYQWILDADAGIFEISNPSLGTGAEISDMTHIGKPVLCVFKRALEERVSAYIRGMDGSHFIKAQFSAIAYENEEDLTAALREFLQQVGPES